MFNCCYSYFFRDPSTQPLLVNSSQVEQGKLEQSKALIQQNESRFKKIKCLASTFLGLYVLSLPMQIYNTVEDFSSDSSSFGARVFDLSLLGLSSSLCLFATCGGVIAYRKYQNWKNSIPSIEHYQGSISENLFFYTQRQREHVVNKDITLPLIQGYFENLRNTLPIIYAFALKKQLSAERAYLALSDEFKEAGGLCAGYTSHLFTMMREHYQTPSALLLKHLKVEEILYGQFLEFIFAQVVHDWEYQSMVHDPKQANKSYLHSLIALADSQLLYIDIENIEKIPTDFQLPLEAIAEKSKSFIEGKQENLSLFTLAGRIRLYHLTKKGHVIFFQFSDIFRFHDSGAKLPGFFEFPTKEAFFEGLNKHIAANWNHFYIEEGSCEITMFAIRK